MLSSCHMSHGGFLSHVAWCVPVTCCMVCSCRMSHGVFLSCITWCVLAAFGCNIVPWVFLVTCSIVCSCMLHGIVSSPVALMWLYHRSMVCSHQFCMVCSCHIFVFLFHVEWRMFALFKGIFRMGCKFAQLRCILVTCLMV